MADGLKYESKRVLAIIKDLNLPKEDVLDFVKSIPGNSGASLNTKLDSEVVGKVYSHFRKEYESQIQHIQKVAKFTEQVNVTLSEAEHKKRHDELERLKKEKEKEELKKKEEQEANIKKAIEERRLQQEEEKARQEQIALAERKKIKQEQSKKSVVKKQEEKKKKDEQGPRRIEKRESGPVTGQDRERKTDTRSEQKEGVKFRDTGRPGRDRERGRDGKPRRDRDKIVKVTIERKLSPGRKPADDTRTTSPPSKSKKFTSSRDVIEKDRKKLKDKKHKTESEYERKKKVKQLKGHRAKDINQKEIDDAIRETFAKIDEQGIGSIRSKARKRKKIERMEQEKIEQEKLEQTKNVIKVTEYISTSELANLMNVEANELIKKSFDLGMMVSINQRLEKDLIVLLAEELGYKIEFQSEYVEDVIQEIPDDPADLMERPPVVTVMGHVDHGKTSLLDRVRKTNVIAGEAGGITQHIGAYTVTLENGKRITFLDTPGHEAFTSMRARGGQAADMVVLVVAADDSVMPQTVEAINHALAANVPIIVAINKIDKPEANPDRIRQQLADRGILVEEWGGKYQSVEISAKQGLNMDKLLEKILLEAELLELKANPKGLSRGVVIEAKLDKGKGTVATLLVQKGTLDVGDVFICGIYSGKIKAMFDEREHKIERAGPSQAVQILGFDGMPQAGDTFVEMQSEREAKEISLKRQQLKREQDFRQVKFITLDDISQQIQEGQQVELNIILKADTDGSAEALADSLQKLSTTEAKIRVIHKAVGQISESDVILAEASQAIIIGFNVRPNLNARKLAESKSIDIRLHNIIYNVIDEIKQALEGMLAPDIQEKVTASVEVREVFKVPKIGNIAGCYVQEGKITRNSKVRLIRDGFVIFDGTISSLKRIKDDVREVEQGYECGIGLENFNDIKIGDIIEAYETIEIKRKLSTNT